MTDEKEFACLLYLKDDLIFLIDCLSDCRKDLPRLNAPSLLVSCDSNVHFARTCDIILNNQNQSEELIPFTKPVVK